VTVWRLTPPPRRSRQTSKLGWTRSRREGNS
jgi:hypothetical protein